MSLWLVSWLVVCLSVFKLFRIIKVYFPVYQVHLFRCCYNSPLVQQDGHILPYNYQFLRLIPSSGSFLLNFLLDIKRNKLQLINLLWTTYKTPNSWTVFGMTVERHSCQDGMFVAKMRPVFKMTSWNLVQIGALFFFFLKPFHFRSSNQTYNTMFINWISLKVE